MFTNALEEYYEQLARRLNAKEISLEQFNKHYDKLMEWEEHYYDQLEERQ